MDKDEKTDPVASNHGRVAHIEGLSQVSQIIPNRPHPPNFSREALRQTGYVHIYPYIHIMSIYVKLLHDEKHLVDLLMATDLEEY